MARSSSPLVAVVLCLAGAATLLACAPAFVPASGSAGVEAAHPQQLRHAAAGAAGAALGLPLAATAETPIPEPVLGIGFLSVIVVIVLVVTGLVVARGLIADDEEDSGL